MGVDSAGDTSHRGTGETLAGSPGCNHKAASLVTDLGFDIHLGGRAAKVLNAEVVRELTESDFALLATERGVQPTHVQRITDRHHALARCLATGMSATEAGLVTGYTASRISVLRGDPSFEELISFYQGERAAPVVDLQQRMTSLALDATAELQDRLELDPTSLSTDQLLDTVKLTADRTGHGPQSKTTNLNVNVNLGDRMKAARERVAALPLPGDRATGTRPVSHEASLAPSSQTVLDPYIMKQPQAEGLHRSNSPITIDGEFSEVKS